jgi:sulfite reductase beta subunit-like hemoprotein
MPANEALTQQELDKIEINPNIDFREIAKLPFAELAPNFIAMFKWSGVYHQLQKGNFMIRISIPGGAITAEQLATASNLAKQYGQNHLCITTRQTLQFHWIRQGDIYKILEGMQGVGMTTRNACGDVCRNVIACSLQGVCPHEVGEIHGVLRTIASDPVIQDQQRNLPRKHKISVGGCASECSQGVMNCEGFYPVQRQQADGTTLRGWRFMAGGGLGSLPHLAKMIFDWVPEELVIHVSRAAVEAHNRLGDRRKRRYARLKIIVERMGPTAFGELLLDLMREAGVTGLAAIEQAGSPVPQLNAFPFRGQTIIPQKQAGLNTVRIMIRRSEFSGDEGTRFAAWASEFGGGAIALTNRQNLEIRDVPDARTGALVDQIKAAGYCVDGFEHLPDVVACVGTTLCNLAVSDTPNAYRAIVDELGFDEALWKAIGPLRINLNGCPNSCAQHWIADIGLRGTRTRGPNGSEEGFAIFVGGRLDAGGHIAELVRDVPASDLVQEMRAILELYLDQRQPDELFGDFARRLGGSGLAALTAPAPIASEAEPINQRNLRVSASLDDVYREARNGGGEK